MHRGQNHARRADSALRTAVFQKRVLHGSRARIGPQSFDCHYTRSLGLEHRHQAAVHQRAIHEHRTRAALTLAASFFRSRQSELFTQHVEKPLHWVRADSFHLAIHREGDVALRGASFCHRTPAGARASLSRIAAEFIASKISSGKSGTKSNGIPSASSIAFTIAGAGPSIGSSPIPFAP